MNKCLIVLTSLLSAAVIAAPVWTWVDDQGRTHYSDRPVEGATQIEVQGSQTFSGAALRGPQTARPAQATDEEPEAVSYTVLDILSPREQETIFNIEGNLAVELATYPALRSDHRIDLLLDGNRVSAGGRSLTVTVPDVYRGEHTLTAVIVDGTGRELRRSAAVTFNVRQNSILTPRPQL